MPECTDCNATISRLYNRLFSEYDPKTSYVQNNILEKCLCCTSVLIKLCKLDVSEQVLKIPMYLPKTSLVVASFQDSCRSRASVCKFV